MRPRVCPIGAPPIAPAASVERGAQRHTRGRVCSPDRVRIGRRMFPILLWLASLAPSQAAEPPSQSKIQTRLLKPSPIEIRLKDLPRPGQTASASKPPEIMRIPSPAILNVPEGFRVNFFAEDPDRPRWLALTPDGDVLVTETSRNRILLLRDKNGDGVAEGSSVFASGGEGLNIPFGMAFNEKHFFVGNSDAVLRWPFQKGQTQIRGRGEKIADLPGGGYHQHWTRNVRVGPDGRLYVTIGSKSNDSEEPLPRASVQRMDADGGHAETFAHGLRNPVGMDFHPVSHEAYVTVNERDGLGDDVPPDYFTRIRAGEFFGWPYVYLSPEHVSPRFANRLPGGAMGEVIRKTITPDVLIRAHSAALGLAFYRGTSFPERYRNGAFVALRGSWNRKEATGYKIIFIPFGADNRPQGSYEDFVTGFLANAEEPSAWGRPVGIVCLPDGSLLFTEEANGRIYRVRYDPPAK